MADKSKMLSLLMAHENGDAFTKSTKDFFQEVTNTANDLGCFRTDKPSEIEYSLVGTNSTDTGVLRDMLSTVSQHGGQKHIKSAMSKVFPEAKFSDKDVVRFCKELEDPKIQLAFLFKRNGFNKGSQQTVNLVNKLCFLDGDDVDILKEFISILENEKPEKLPRLIACFIFFVNSCMREKSKEYKHYIAEFFTNYLMKVLQNLNQTLALNDENKKRWKKVLKTLRYAYSVEGLVTHLKQVDAMILDCENHPEKERNKLKKILCEHRERACHWFLGLSKEFPFIKTEDMFFDNLKMLKMQLENKKALLEKNKSQRFYNIKTLLSGDKEKNQIILIDDLLVKISEVCENKKEKKWFVEHIESLLRGKKTYDKALFIRQELFNFLLLAKANYHDNFRKKAEPGIHVNFLKLNIFQLRFANRKLLSINKHLAKEVSGVFHWVKTQINRFYYCFETQVVEAEKNIVEEIVASVNKLRVIDTVSSDLFDNMSEFQKLLIDKYKAVCGHESNTQQSRIYKTLRFLSYYFINTYKNFGIDAFKENYSSWLAVDLLAELKKYQHQRIQKPIFTSVHTTFMSIKYYIADFFNFEKKPSLKNMTILEQDLDQKHVSIAAFAKYCDDADKIIQKIGEKNDLSVLLKKQKKRIVEAMENGDIKCAAVSSRQVVPIVSKKTKDIIKKDPHLLLFYSTIVNQLSNQLLAMKVISTKLVSPAYSYSGSGIGFSLPALGAKVAEMTGLPWMSAVGNAASSAVFYCDMNNTAYQFNSLLEFLASQENMDKLIKQVATSMVRIWEFQIQKIAEGDPENVKYFASCAVERMSLFLLSGRYTLYPDTPLDVLLCASVRIQKMFHGFWQNRFVMKDTSSRFSTETWKVEDIFEKTPVAEKSTLYASAEMTEEFGYARDGGKVATQILHLPKKKTIECPMQYETRSPATAVPGFSISAAPNLLLSPATPFSRTRDPIYSELDVRNQTLESRVGELEREVVRLNKEVTALKRKNSGVGDAPKKKVQPGRLHFHFFEDSDESTEQLTPIKSIKFQHAPS